VVQPLLSDWTAELEQMTGRSFDEWQSVKLGAGNYEQAVREEVWLPEGVVKDSSGRAMPLLAQPGFSM
jgi:hypothetical protein